MEWTADVAEGDWIRERLDDGPAWGRSMHGVVPRGFAAYARLLHPVIRERPAGRDWPPAPYSLHARQWDAFMAQSPQIDAEQVTWAQAADAFGARMHPLVQWCRIAGIDPMADREDDPRDAAGWRYSDPPEGGTDPDSLARIAGHLAGATTAPDDGFVAVWDGWGGLVGFLGETPSRLRLTMSADAQPAPHRAVLDRLVKDPFNNPYRRRSWQPGILSDEISRGPRLALPAREHVLFRGGVAEFAAPDWVRTVPWAEDEGLWTPSPSLIWPADRAWVLVAEVDWDSTVVGGAPALIDALCADPALEAFEIPAEADLSWSGDRLNG